MNDKFNKLIFVACVLGILITCTFVVPLYLLTTAYNFSNLLISTFNADNQNKYVLVFYTTLYLFCFFLLYFNKYLRKDTSYILFSLMHYIVFPTVLFYAFAPADGQSVFLIYPYCLLSVLLLIPIGHVWKHNSINQC